MIPKKWMFCFALALALAGTAQAVDLNFDNHSNESIPLEIPGVMNPNLSANSRSGVSLERGQKVYFRIHGRRALLLEIRDERDGQVIVVNELVAKRTAEINAAKP